jgi:hypothetical protein
MAGTALSIKVSDKFSKRFRQFCEDNCLQIGRFTEAALEEVMEDYHFGKKAQRVLVNATGKAPTTHAKLRKP